MTGKKYFVAFCTMDSTHLRANPFYHSCLILLEADTQQNERVSPLRATHSFGFYSTKITEKVPFFSDPFTFFSQYVIHFRLNGNYGLWQEEAIHDLAYGQGLAGRVFEITQTQLNRITENYAKKIKSQKDFFKGITDQTDREEAYHSALVNEMIMLENEGMSIEEAIKEARKRIPLSEFKYSIHKDGYTCKVAAIEMIKLATFDAPPSFKKQVESLETFQATNTLPRLTKQLKSIVIDAYSEQWQSKIKYPFLSWSDSKNDARFSMIVVDFGGHYINKEGMNCYLEKINASDRRIINDLKIVNRLFQIYNHADAIFKEWQRHLHEHLYSIAIADTSEQKSAYALAAKQYLMTLINHPAFEEKMNRIIPANLSKQYENILNRYQKEEIQENEIFHTHLRLC